MTSLVVLHAAINEFEGAANYEGFEVPLFLIRKKTDAGFEILL